MARLEDLHINLLDLDSDSILNFICSYRTHREVELKESAIVKVKATKAKASNGNKAVKGKLIKINAAQLEQLRKLGLA